MAEEKRFDFGAVGAYRAICNMGATGAPGCRTWSLAAGTAAVLIALLLTLASAAAAQVATTTSLSGPTTATTGIYAVFEIAMTPSSPGGPMPSGSVQVLDNATPVPNCSYTPPPPAGYQANCDIQFSQPGRHQMTARYSGDDNYAASTSPALTVMVSPPPPRYANLMAVNVTSTTARLYATILNPEEAVQWRFQFGPTTRYGETTPVRTLPRNTRTNSNALAPLRDLKPGTRYHFRLILTTPYTTLTSGDHTFKTPPRGR